MLKRFDLASVKTAITPMETKVPLIKNESAADVDVHLYRSMIGSLMYLTASRPDIMFAVCACSRFQVTPKTLHLNAEENLKIPKSITGGCQFLGKRLISWQCKKQTIVATSTTEAEYVAAASCCGQVGFLRKPDESTGLAEIVDFLKGSHIRYALTHNPTIYDSLVKQFWQTATALTLANGTLELKATIDNIVYTITESSIRSKLQLADASGISMLPNTEVFEGMRNIGYPTDGTFTFWKSHFTPQWRFLIHHVLHCLSPKSRGWDQFGSNIATALICLSTGQEGTSAIPPPSTSPPEVHPKPTPIPLPTPTPILAPEPTPIPASATVPIPESTSTPPSILTTPVPRYPPPTSLPSTRPPPPIQP
ncbi:hypothetical protein Tco_0285602 [Tanacetum coccineum]